MKIKVCVSYEQEYDIDNDVIDTLYNIHRDPDAIAPVETYVEAEKVVEMLTGLPVFGQIDNTKPSIYAVYAEDNTPIFEY